ncbi:type I-C CRISPR-associated endonuclease Cas1c [Aminipila luticellarii]|uniref:CRISPR-associated endonuclease Cas1 n=1 Tax=Aminipila luticellarii TaxID=2507160 RepID=A0A410PWT5_9FIRM|nr:type I-C CRISPR-associated endonuclease Cas1c [Aminipila luticellarii]QAT43422.1 type I-C CRISPR-associated endonuclease Cas1 [Aminipila luticellarii]
MKKLLNVLFVTQTDAKVYLETENVCVRKEDELLIRVPLLNLEQIVLFNYYGATPQLLGECVKRKISVSFLSEYGKYYGTFHGESSGNVLLRREQYRIADDNRGLEYAKAFIFGKLHNQKWVIERGIRDYSLRIDTPLLKKQSSFISEQLKQVLSVDSGETLRAAEGNAAHYYFSAFDELILQNKEFFTFKTRNRRPPTDAVNAMLSFAYTLLASECRHALEVVGLDSYVGFLHADRPGRASLALDLMEELRPHVADRFVLSLINRSEVAESDFEVQSSGAVYLSAQSRKKFLSSWQNRKKEEIVHPFLKEKIEWGLVPYCQALLLARTIRGDLDGYPPFLWK